MWSPVTRASRVLVVLAVLGLSVAACAGPPAHVRGAPAATIAASDVPAPALRAGERFLSLVMPQPYTPVPPNGGTDEYRRLLLDPHLSQAPLLTGSQFLPRNPA